jgi:hypothetical protein
MRRWLKIEKVNAARKAARRAGEAAVEPAQH